MGNLDIKVVLLIDVFFATKCQQCVKQICYVTKALLHDIFINKTKDMLYVVPAEYGIELVFC